MHRSAALPHFRMLRSDKSARFRRNHCAPYVVRMSRKVTTCNRSGATRPIRCFHCCCRLRRTMKMSTRRPKRRHAATEGTLSGCRPPMSCSTNRCSTNRSCRSPTMNPSEGGGPPGPSGPPPGPPGPLPGPLAKAALKTSFSSLAWSLVSLPLDTSFGSELSIFDLRSPGEISSRSPDRSPGPLFSAVSISVSAG